MLLKDEINDFSIIRPVNTEHWSFLLKKNFLEEYWKLR